MPQKHQERPRNYSFSRLKDYQQCWLIAQDMDLLKHLMLRKNLGVNSWKYIYENHTCKIINDLYFNYSLHRLILLVDMSVGLMDSDKMLIKMLADTHRPFMIVLTKADKVKEP